jgi:5-methylthioadenosine/S-adenosylhomocysteine deaminase
MSRIVLRGRYVVCEPGDLPGGGMIENGALLIEDGRVRFAGRAADLEGIEGVQTLGSERHLVIPGLSNAHTHGRGLMGIQTGMPDGYFEPWLLDYWVQHPLDVYLDTLYANMRMIRSGVTRVMHSGYSRDWSRTEDEVRDTLRAYADCGLRVAYAVGMENRNTFVYEDNEAFLARLPENLASRVKAQFDNLGPANAARTFEFIAELCAEYAGHPAIRIFLGPTGPEWCSDDLLARCAAQAERLDTGIHLHCLESLFQREYAARAYNRTSIEILRDLGITGPRTSMAHGTWASQSDFAILAETGTTVCHNASSNLRLRVGIAPVAQMLDAGVRVAIGMDGQTLNNDDDILQEMRLVRTLHRLPRGPGFDAEIDSFEILRMATLNGARATNFGPEAGRLAPGCLGDAVVLDYDALTHPHVGPEIHPIDALVQLGKASHIDAVVIGGRPVFAEGEFTELDEAGIAQELGAIAAQPMPEGSRQMRQVMGELQPHVQAFYAEWEAKTLSKPGYLPNALG